MKTKIRSKWLIMSFLLFSNLSFSQQNFSLKEAVDYAVKNHVNIRNAQLDILNAEARVNEIKGIGLPQINGNFGYTNNIIIQKVFIPARTFDPSVFGVLPGFAIARL